MARDDSRTTMSVCQLFLILSLQPYVTFMVAMQGVPLSRSIQCRLDGITALLGIAKQHLRVWTVVSESAYVLDRPTSAHSPVKHRVDYVRVAGTHASLHYDDLLALVCIDDWHSSDRAKACQRYSQTTHLDTHLSGFRAIGLTVSLAPMTSVTSTSSNPSSLISSISSTIS